MWVCFDDDDDDDKYYCMPQLPLYKHCQLNIMILSFLELEDVHYLCSHCVYQSDRCSYL